MKRINISKYVVTTIGRVGENRAVTIVFDCITELRELYGPGTVQLIAQRSGDAEPYPVVIETDEAEVRWIVTNADTAVAGEGKCELQYYAADSTLAKSMTFRTKVAPALGEPSEEPPEPWEDWVQRVLVAGSVAEEAAEEAAESANDAETTAEIVKSVSLHPAYIGATGTWYTWDTAISAYADSEIPATGPQGAQGVPGQDGADGKSAYEAAQDGGYTGTETQFNDDLASAGDKYEKPENGIPETDLASYVQTKLNRTEIKWAEKDVTTAQQIYQWMADGYVVAMKFESVDPGFGAEKEHYFCSMAYWQKESSVTVYYAQFKGYGQTIYKIRNSIWTSGVEGYEISSRKVTSLSSASSNTQYPSAKCVYDALAQKQNALVSGTNIKTIDGESILGVGDFATKSASLIYGTSTWQQTSMALSNIEKSVFVLKTNIDGKTRQYGYTHYQNVAGAGVTFFFSCILDNTTVEVVYIANDDVWHTDTQTIGGGLPTVTSADAGKVLTVNSSGAWVAAELPVYDGTVE